MLFSKIIVDFTGIPLRPLRMSSRPSVGRFVGGRLGPRAHVQHVAGGRSTGQPVGQSVQRLPAPQSAAAAGSRRPPPHLAPLPEPRPRQSGHVRRARLLFSRHARSRPHGRR